MRKSFEATVLIIVLVASAALTIGLTYVPCYSSLCSEEYYPLETRIHIAFYYALLASMGVALCLRAVSPLVRRISETYLYSKELPVFGRRISVGGVAASIWLVGLTLATTGFWLDAIQFWAERTDPFDWVDGKVRLLVTCVVGHHIGVRIVPLVHRTGTDFNRSRSNLYAIALSSQAVLKETSIVGY